MPRISNCVLRLGEKGTLGMHRTLVKTVCRASAALLIATAACGAAAQTTSPVMPRPSQTTPAKPATPPDEGQEGSEPTLDEMLGLPTTVPPPVPVEERDAGTPDRVSNPDDDLKRALQDADKPSGFGDIVELMSAAGARLSARADAGLDTQRTQEDALRKLDRLIAEAKKQQQKKKQKSKPKDQQEQSPSERQQQQQQQASQGEAQSAGQASSGGGPARKDGALKPPLAGGEASWGNLPPHLRDALRQGSSDRFSAIYRTLTEQYYKRLAEEPRSPGPIAE